MWQTKYALAVPKNLGLGLNFRLCSEYNRKSAKKGDFENPKVINCDFSTKSVPT